MLSIGAKEEGFRPIGDWSLTVPPNGEKRRKRVYIAGPMSGVPFFNAPAFDAMANILRGAGLDVFSPSEHDREIGINPKDYPTGDTSNLGTPLREIAATDLAYITEQADALYLLPGWEKSRGATVEKLTADWIGIPVFGHVGTGPQAALPARPGATIADLPESRFPESRFPENIKWSTEESMRVQETAAWRKDRPLARGVLDYFPDALLEVAYTSKVGNDQHNPGQPMHWAKEKSTDHADCILRHLAERGKLDSDGIRHSAKAAWRALALLQIEIESERTK